MADSYYPFVAMHPKFGMQNEENVVTVHRFESGDYNEFQDARRWVTLPIVIIDELGNQTECRMTLSVNELSEINKQVQAISKERGWNVTYQD